MKPARLSILRKEGFQSFEVETDPRMTLLDALEQIRESQASDLLYRHSCHHGSCGTCAVLVNGAERLLCTARLSQLAQGEEIRIEPLRGMKVVGDLAVNPRRVFVNLPQDASYLEPAHGATEESRKDREKFEDCIECGICLSACPIPTDRLFLGPAALAAFYRQRKIDPKRSEDILARVAQHDGVAACDRHFNCSRACPMGVAPGRRIQELRKDLSPQ